MSITRTIRIICSKEHEETISKAITDYNFYIRERYYRGIIILVVDIPKYGTSKKVKQLLNLQDELLKISK